MTWCDCWCNFSVRIDACYEQPRRQDEAFGDRKFCFSSIFKLLGWTEWSFPVFCVKPWKSPALQEFQISHSGVSATLPLPFSVRAFSTKWNSSKLLISLKISSKPSLLWKGEKKIKSKKHHISSFSISLPSAFKCSLECLCRIMFICSECCC